MYSKDSTVSNGLEDPKLGIACSICNKQLVTDDTATVYSFIFYSSLHSSFNIFLNIPVFYTQLCRSLNYLW